MSTVFSNNIIIEVRIISDSQVLKLPRKAEFIFTRLQKGVLRWDENIPFLLRFKFLFMIRKELKVF